MAVLFHLVLSQTVIVALEAALFVVTNSFFEADRSRTVVMEMSYEGKGR